MSDQIPTLREYVEYVESFDRPLDIDALVAEGWARDLDARELVNGEAIVADLEPLRAERTGRRRWLVVAAAAVAVVAMVVTVLAQGTGHEGIRTGVPAGPGPSVTTAPAPPTTVSPNPGFDALTRTEGATPSLPKAGELVASAWRPRVGVSYFYADGRLIWLDDVNGTPGWVEQRLTPEAVERVRVEFLASGLFDPKQGITGPLPDEYLGPRLDPVGCLVCVRHGGRLLARNVQSLVPDEDLVVERLAMLPSSLPPTDWADQQIRAYVPSTYAVCLGVALPGGRRDYSLNADPSEALKALPPRAAKLLRGRQTVDDFGLTDGTCFSVATGKARLLAHELVDAFGAPALFGGLSANSKYGFEMKADVNRPHLKRFGISFTQLLPDGELAFYYPAKN